VTSNKKITDKNIFVFVFIFLLFRDRYYGYNGQGNKCASGYRAHHSEPNAKSAIDTDRCVGEG
jgi:hypothetical protein